ncbi:MAG: hypothetical protein ACXAB4_03235 [Candidatus Hodarchaeales archaeon]
MQRRPVGTILIVFFLVPIIARAELNQRPEWKLKAGDTLKWNIEKLQAASLYIGNSHIPLKEGDNVELQILELQSRIADIDSAKCKIKIGNNETIVKEQSGWWIFTVHDRAYYENEVDEINKDENRNATLLEDIMTINFYYERPTETIEITRRLNIAKGYLIYHLSHHHNKEQIHDFETEIKMTDTEISLNHPENDFVIMVIVGLSAFGAGIGVAYLLRRRRRLAKV